MIVRFNGGKNVLHTCPLVPAGNVARREYKLWSHISTLNEIFSHMSWRMGIERELIIKNDPISCSSIKNRSNESILDASNPTRIEASKGCPTTTQLLRNRFGQEDGISDHPGGSTGMTNSLIIEKLQLRARAKTLYHTNGIKNRQETTRKTKWGISRKKC